MDKRDFAFTAGSPALDFLDTYGNRVGVGVEHLGVPSDLARWLDEARVVSLPSAAIPTQALDDARRLRDALFAAVAAVIDGTNMPEDALEIIHDHVSKPPLRPRLLGDRLQWDAPRPVEAALSTLAADGLAWLAAPARARLRRCPGCAMVFADLSRPGRRRWCSSQTGCGNRAKVARHRSRARNPDSLRKANP